MKHILLLLNILSYITLFSQSPNLINYQSVVRNSAGIPVPENTPVQFKFTIHDSSPTGTVVYSETSNLYPANQFGLVYLPIGVNGNLGSVNWASGEKHLNIQVKIGSANFTDMGTTQLLSVPYAYFASSAAIADSIRGGAGNSNSNGNSITVKYNSLPLSDPGIDHAILSVSSNFVSALTATNYSYGLYKGQNTIQTFSTLPILATDTTSSNPTLYIYTFPLGCSITPYPYTGQVLGVNTNHTTGIYYVPVNAVATSSIPQLYSYSCTTGHWTVWQAQYLPTYQYLQLVANNNTVTGFNLQFPVSVSITR
jgi:hypothetical protein